MSVPGPPPSSASVDVGAAARSDAVSLGVAADVSVALALGLAAADAVALDEGVADGVPDVCPFAAGVEAPLPACADGVDPEVALGVVALGVVGFGAAVVGFGFGAVFVGVGVLVLVAAGGAMPGCWPEPNRKPTTEPGAGLYDAAPLEL